MGTFLSFLSKQTSKPTSTPYSKCLNISIQQLRHQYSSFASICQDYGIDSFSYSEIFDGDFDSFKIWDSNGTGKIDAFELFSGLILFSNGKFKQKIEFLFEIFDLNEEETLSYEVLQFLIINACVATLRIYRVEVEIVEEEIEEFLNQYFCLDSSITKNQLIVWTTKSEQVLLFFKLINQQTPENSQSFPILNLADHPKTARKKIVFKEPFFDLYRKQITDDYSSITPIYHYLEDPDFTNPITELHPAAEWIFGLRYNDIRQPINCAVTSQRQAANQKLFYFIGCVAIIYYPKLQVQEYYFNHKKEISCLKVSKSKSIVATGEHGRQPRIHIWDLTTKETIKVFSEIHRHTIIALEFVSNDSYLVSVSETQDLYPFAVQNVKNGEVLFSGQLTGYFINMMENKCDSNESSFTFMCHKSYENYHFTDQAFLRTCKPISDSQDQYLDSVYYYDSSICCTLIVSSAKEKIYFFNEKDPRIVKLSERIVSMKIIEKYLYAMSQKEVYEIELRNKNVRCLKIGLELTNDSLIQLVSTNNSLYLLTNMGLVYNYNLQSRSIKKVPQLFGVDNPKATYSFPLHNQLYLSSGPYLWVIDTKSKQLKHLKSNPAQISSIYVDQYNTILGSQQGTLFIYKNKTDLPIIKQLQKFPIKDIALANKESNLYTSLLVLVQKSVLIFNYDELILTKQHKLQHVELQKIARSPVDNLMLGMSSEKQIKMFKIECQSFKEIESSRKSEYIQTKIDGKPILFHPQKNLLIVAGRKGKIHFWNDYWRAREGKELIEELGGHASEIFELLEYEDYEGFMSVGASDQMIVQWASLRKHKRNLNEIRTFKEENVLKAEFDRGLELEESPEQLRDSLAVIKPITDKCHNDIIQQILLPENEKYEALLDPKKSKDQMRLAPLISIKLTKVLGFQCHNVRKSLFYSHYYKQASSSFEPSSYVSKQPVKLKVLPLQLQNELLYSKQNLLPYIESHSNCSKKLVYFSDRIGIVHDVTNNEQKFYQHHKNKITAMCIHPNKQLICSVECPSLTNDSLSVVINRSKLHIWNSFTLKRQVVLEHCNSGVVHRVQFSRSGKYLCTLTKLHKQDSSSIQIYDWENNLFIAQRIFPNQVLLDFEFNPYQPMQITVVGVGVIAILKIVNTLLIVKQRHSHSEKQVVSCLAYVYNCYGDTVESDILTGSSQGDISLLICGKYIKVREKAHDGVINCLKVGELFQYMIVLITAGQDNHLKIWNTKMQLMLSINIKNLSCFGGNFSQFSQFCNYSPQSLDIYHCISNGKEKNKPVTNILIGTRGGDIVELTVKYEESTMKKGLKEKQSGQEEENALEGVITYDSKAYLRNASSQNMIGFAIYKDIMLTFNQKQCVYIWDLAKFNLISIKKVRSTPSTIKFSHSGEIFIIGYTTGQIQLFQANFSKDFTPIQTIMNSGSSVINIFFSTTDKKIVVSLISQRHAKDSGHQDFVSEVHAYIKGPAKDSFLSRKDFNKFTSKVELNNKSMSKNMGVCFMDFSTNQQIVLLRYQPMKNGRRVYHQKLNKYIMWNIETNQILNTNEGNVEFNYLNFCNTINTSYIYRHLVETKLKQENLQAEVSQMSQYEKFICLGMTNGEIILAQASAFYNEKSNSSFGKIYKAHSSCIENMKVEQGHLYTSGLKNKSIMIWKLDEQLQKWDYDSANIHIEDTFSQKYTKERLNKYLNDIFPKRRNIFEVYGNIKTEEKLPVKITLNKVLGRNAYYKRNNLFYNFNDSIITHSGCNILIMSKEGNLPLEQKIAQLDKNLIFFLPEISAMSISNNRKLLAIGTFSEEAKIFIWDISSETTVFELSLKEIIEVHHLSLSDNCKYIVCTGLSNQNSLILFLVDVQRSAIVACHDFSYTVNTKIHDVIFLPGEESAFITCGLHNLTLWNYSCGLFNSDVYQVEAQQNSKNHNQQPINFYSMIFVKNILVTAASDGYIYIWKGKKLWKKQSAHPNYSILVLHTTTGSQIFASGGTDGKVIFWQLSGDVVQKLSQFEIFEFNRENPITIKHHIQSICIGKEKMVVGTRCGDIYEFDKPKEISSKSDSKNRRLILPAFNHEKIVSICFSSSSRWFYLLTEKGSLQVHQIQTLTKLYTKQLLLNSQQHKQKTVLKMFVCIQSDLIYIIYKEEIELYEFKKEKLKPCYVSKDRKEEMVVKLASYPIKEVVEAMISPNEKHLACLVNADKNLKIVIFNFDRVLKVTEIGDWFKVFHTIEIFSQLHFFDFSNDSNYFLRVHIDNSFVLDLKDNREVTTPNREQTIEWVGQGKLKLEAFKDITSVFRNAKHKLLEVVQITNKCVVVTDEIGSLLIFGYPAKGYLSANFYHLNNVYICQVSPDNKTLITVSEYDKSIHIWDIEEQEQSLGRKRTYPSIFDTE